MRNASPGLIAFLNSATQVYVADLLTIAQLNGTITRITNAPQVLTAVSQYDGASHSFVPGSQASAVPTFSRDRVKYVVGLEVDSMGLNLYTNPTQLLGGIPWPQAARQGAFDGARVMVERLYMPTFGDTTLGTLIVFAGLVGQVQPTSTVIAMTVNSDLIQLSLPVPKNVYASMCSHNLYDSGCALSRAAFTDAGTCAGGCTTSTIFSTGMPHLGPNYYAQGVLTFTSGANNGLWRPVKIYNASVFTLAPPLPAAPAPGDTFSVTAGCDKVVALNGDVTLGTCQTRFNNLVHARAYPFVPTPENAR